MSDSVTPWTVARQAPLSMGFSRQEFWSGLPCPPPGDLPDPGVEFRSPALQADSLPSEPPGMPRGLIAVDGIRCEDYPASIHSLVVVQPLSHVHLFVTPWVQHTRLPCPSPSQSFPNFMSTESVMPSNHLILCPPPLLLLSIFPSIKVSSSESALENHGILKGTTFTGTF